MARDQAGVGVSAPLPIEDVCREPVEVRPAGAGYEFSLDGAALEPVVEALDGSDTRSPGSVVHVHGFAMVLGPPGRYQYFSPREHADELELSFDGGPRQLVALRVGLRPRPVPRADGRSALFDEAPAGGVKIDARPRGELQHLRGLVLERWDDRIAGPVAGLEGSQLFLKYAVGPTEVDGGAVVPAQLPADLGYLSLEVSDSLELLAVDVAEAGPRAVGLAGLERFTRLRYLQVDRGRSIRGGPSYLEAAGLAGLTTLERLDVQPAVGLLLREPERLGALVKLRALDLSWHDEVVDLEFVRRLVQLRWLDIRSSGVVSLAALAGHPGLVEIVADGAPVTTLPELPPPGLRTLSLLSTRVEDEASERLAAAAPGAVIRHRWDRALEAVAACATRIQVRSGGTCHRGGRTEKTLFASEDPAVLRELLPLLRVDEANSTAHCMCCGNFTIELYRGAEPLTVIGYHHGRSVRWEGWPGDGLLADPAGLCQWLEGRGVAGACPAPKDGGAPRE